jgi:hypothetical protein
MFNSVSIKKSTVLKLSMQQKPYSASLTYIRPMGAVPPVWACRHKKGHPSEKKGDMPIFFIEPVLT